MRQQIGKSEDLKEENTSFVSDQDIILCLIQSECTSKILYRLIGQDKIGVSSWISKYILLLDLRESQFLRQLRLQTSYCYTLVSFLSSKYAVMKRIIVFIRILYIVTALVNTLIHLIVLSNADYVAVLKLWQPKFVLSLYMISSAMHTYGLSQTCCSWKSKKTAPENEWRITSMFSSFKNGLIYTMIISWWCGK